MATNKPALHKFIVYALDRADPDTLYHRESLREAHMQAVGDYIKNGVFKAGGAILSDDSITSPDAERKIIGSLIIIEAESLQAVKDILSKDPYCVSGKWDSEKVAIHPFYCAIGLQ
ncbi:hypothetical protein CERSUDRAFT_150776 [Gelatoporia subvermispora B]|uniref:YCII-related domain-containing protein n=1 Tax=Ceriporiopsis subvermispora (strain B) TaxID=914234 RepID=M2RM97_CERS8|nr:hypothetical protein CERSUDRAFT_150776 [Gelatoporia subvermispora B]